MQTKLNGGLVPLAPDPPCRSACKSIMCLKEIVHLPQIFLTRFVLSQKKHLKSLPKMRTQAKVILIISLGIVQFVSELFVQKDLRSCQKRGMDTSEMCTQISPNQHSIQLGANMNQFPLVLSQIYHNEDGYVNTVTKDSHGCLSRRKG